MRIKLEHPFLDEFCKAYLSISNADGRARVSLHREDGSGTFMQYARYLMSVKEGRILSENEEVDHIDKDKTNDSISNLQILTIEDHKNKTKDEMSGRTCITLVCAYCGSQFERELRQFRYKRDFCSRSCNGKFYHQINNNLMVKKVTDEDVLNISDLMSQGLSSYKIAEKITHLSRGTISRYMRQIRNSGIDLSQEM